jgi:phosphatidylglycerophosphate synthase
MPATNPPPEAHTSVAIRIPASQFYAVNRGGGLYSEAVSQRLGALVAAAAYRLGVAPTVLTLLNVALGLATTLVAVTLMAGAGPADGSGPRWPVGLLALVLWQGAYALDCADGQLARVTGRTSDAGARVDVLGDVVTHVGVVTVLSTAAVTSHRGTPAWLIAAFAGTWMVNLIAGVLHSGPLSASIITSRAVAVRVGKLVRDFGAVVAACGLVLISAPQWTQMLVIVFTVVNGGYLAASIVSTADAAVGTRMSP